MTLASDLRFRAAALLVAVACSAGYAAAEADDKPAADKPAEPKTVDGKHVNDKIREIAGRAEVLKAVHKHFATLKAVDAAGACRTSAAQTARETPSTPATNGVLR